MQIGSSNSKNEFSADLDSSDFDPIDQTNDSFDPIEDNINVIDHNQLEIMNNSIKEGILSGKFPTNVYIEKSTFFQIDTQTGDDGILQAQELSDPKQISKAFKKKELFVEAQLSNGQRLMKGFPDAVKRAQSAQFINVIGKNGQIQRTIETKDVKIEVFTSKDLYILSYSMMAFFAASEARKRLEIERKEEEERKRKEEEQLKQSKSISLNELYKHPEVNKNANLHSHSIPNIHKINVGFVRTTKTELYNMEINEKMKEEKEKRKERIKEEERFITKLIQRSVERLKESIEKSEEKIHNFKQMIQHPLIENSMEE